MTLGLWVPHHPEPPIGLPSDLPLGRAALALGDEGLDVILGQPAPGGFMGHRATTSGWVATGVEPVRAVFDRFPSVGQAAAFQQGLAHLGTTLLGNSVAYTALCRDKLATQRALEAAGVDLPPVEPDPARFVEALNAWGAAYLKPRFGSFGEGVQRVVPGDALPIGGDWVLQRAVPPPDGFAGVSVRVLVQRRVEGGWLARPGVARRSVDDPVVNAARGAQVVPVEDVMDAAAVQALSVRCAVALEQACPGLALESGLDLVIDQDGRAWPIEANGRPRGRLRALASRWPERFEAEHVDACAQPLRVLHALSPR